jgi:hypothetical protein
MLPHSFQGEKKTGLAVVVPASAVESVPASVVVLVPASAAESVPASAVESVPADVAALVLLAVK